MKTLTKDSEILSQIPFTAAAVRVANEKLMIEQLARISEATLEGLKKGYSWFNSYLPKSVNKSRFTSDSDLQEYLKKRIAAKYGQRLEKEIAGLESILSAPNGSFSITVSVEWKKSRMWGSNPSASAHCFAGGLHEGNESGSIGGCGYDKLSTAVASVLNECKPLVKFMLLRWEDLLSQGKPVSLREDIGYGSGYGQYPRFEGGVGVNCFDRICTAAGLVWENVASGSTFDVFKVSKA